MEGDAAFAEILYRNGAERCRDQLLLLASAAPERQDLAIRRAVATATWQRPIFPLRGADVLALGFSPGPTVSALLNELESWWAAGGFRADREACLKHLRARVQTTVEGP